MTQPCVGRQKWRNLAIVGTVRTVIEMAATVTDDGIGQRQSRTNALIRNAPRPTTVAR